jgi:hypothetical protein
MLWLAVLIFVQSVDGAEPPTGAQADREQKLQKLMEASLDWYKVSPQSECAPLKAQVVMSWRNAVRGEQAKDLLALWVDDGRPVAAASIFPWDGKLCHEFGSLSRETGLIARNGDAVVWSPRVAGVEFQDVPDAPTPAEAPGPRLRQMKVLAERFTATLIGWKANEAGPEQLRLLPRPLYRYEIMDSRADADLLDGALLAFVQGTDPEVLLLVEAVKSDKRPRWQYAFARATSGSLEARLGDAIVWQVDELADTDSATNPQIVLRRKIED